MVRSRQTCRSTTGIRIPPFPRATTPKPETAPAPVQAPALAPALSGCLTGSRLSASSTTSLHVSRFSTARSDIQPTASELSRNRREVEEEEAAEEAEYPGVFDDPARLAVVWKAAQAKRENKVIVI